MRRTSPGTLVAATTLAAAALAGCGSTGADQAPASTTRDIPAGVAEQYAALDREVAERGGTVTSGEWEVSYIVEAAEPWYDRHDGEQRYRRPTGTETHHVEIIPREASTGRIVPDVPITLAVLDDTGAVVESARLNFFHSTFFHYANNLTVPEDGRYSLRATLGAPTFLRHGDEGETPALSAGTTVTFDDVALTTD